MSEKVPAANSTAAVIAPNDDFGRWGNRGFSLVELLAVVAILTALTLMAIPSYSKIKDKVREVRAMEEIRGLEKAVTAFSIDKGGALPINLAALLIPIANDPWDNPYEYHPLIGTGYPPRLGLFGAMTPLNDDFDLYSRGSDGLSDQSIEKPESQDDVVRSGNGGFVGMANALSP